MTDQVTKPTAGEIAAGLRKLATFIEQHPEVAGRLSTVGARDGVSRYSDDLNVVAALLTLDPTTVTEHETLGHELVWDFGGGVTFRRAVQAEHVGEQHLETALVWRTHTVDELKNRYLSDRAVA